VLGVSNACTYVDEFRNRSVEFDAVDKDGNPKRVKWSTRRSRTTYSNAVLVVPIDEHGRDISDPILVDHFAGSAQ
jgi:hypothetical protein